jgi:SpoVK/Ycf46/Vps4 family AAA+-type ATPase
MEKRLQLQELFRETHFFYRQGILWLEPVKEGEPVMSGRIVLPQENIERILFGRESAPRYGLDFPAKQIVTAMEWNDVVLHPRTMQQVKDISTWLNHHHRFAEDNNLRRKIKPGYRVLFYGPSGTGKTLTAALLGKEFGKDVYRIDLSQIVSKYIGETEKNLEAVFKRAESKDWILFFDEADALFGKRTSVQSSHDKYANQEVSYLLQRVEDYPGLLILASNFKNNLDEAFLRRFHSVVHFPMPNTAERHHLWKKTMPAGLQHDTSVNLLELADQFELTGASILNAVQFATLQSYARGDGTLLQSDLLEGVKKEFLKEEKSF